MKKTSIKYSVTVYSGNNSAYSVFASTLEEARKIATEFPANMWPALIRAETRSICQPVEKYICGTIAKVFDTI